MNAPAAPAESIPETAAAATNRDGWLEIMGLIGQDSGFFQALGTRHWAAFHDQGPQLLVTFDTMEGARARKGQMPHLWDLASEMGWSYLCVIADGETWFRDPAVFAFFDRQVDDCFFDEYDQVLFYGAGMAGYAACAYSVASPGAQVLAVSPRATLSPARVPWERRNPDTKRMDFTSRYGHAPDMVQGAAAVWLLVDPGFAPDAIQAAMFHGPHVTRLNLGLMSERVETALQDLDVLPLLLEAAMKGKMRAGVFYRHWRARRKYGPYLKLLLTKADLAQRETLSYAIASNVARRTRAPRFLRRLAEMDAARAEAQTTPA